MDKQNDSNTGARVRRTREQIRDDLIATRDELGGGIDLARAIIAIETVERIEEEQEQKFQAIQDEIRRLYERLELLVVGYMQSQHSGDQQAAAEFRKVLQEIKQGGRK